MIARLPQPLVWTTALHLALAAACAVALAVGTDAPRVLGLHPAVKPLKFAVSIAALLGTVALVLAVTDADARAKSAIAWVLSATMIVEIAIIVAQALRGTTSHFNTRTPLDAALWSAMGVAILGALVALTAFAWIVTVAPLRCSPLVAFAVRAGAWLVLLSAVSGFAMGGRGAHSVGGLDGGAGSPITGWSVSHGDLRVPHFVALHGLQALPIAALVLDRLPLGLRARWASLALITGGWIALALVTLLRALAGRPWW